jgi:outer membrane protein assembly factor BamB
MKLATSASLRCRRAACGAVAVLSFFSIVAAAEGQSMFRGDPAHSGISTEAGPAVLKGVKWAFKTEGAVVSSPVSSGGVLFVGSDDKNLYALEQATGALKWKFATGAPVRSTPAVADGAVYFVSYDGNFYALDAAGGALRWKFETAGERKFTALGLHGYFPRQQPMPDYWDLFQSSPVVGGGAVYFGSGDGHIYALDAANGALRWKVKTGDVVHGSPALVDGTLYVGSWDTNLYALDATTGAVKWKFKTGEDPVNFNQTGIQSSPCVADGTVYFGGRDSTLYAVDAKTGAEKWKYKNAWGSWFIASPVVRDGRVYSTTSEPAFLLAHDAATGKELYKTGVKAPAFSSMTLAGKLAYLGNFAGSLLAIDLAEGKVIWTFQTPAAQANANGYLKADGALDFAKVFTSGFFEDMYAGGAKLFALGAIVASPAVSGGVVFVGSADGTVYAIE